MCLYNHRKCALFILCNAVVLPLVMYKLVPLFDKTGWLNDDLYASEHCPSYTNSYKTFMNSEERFLG